MKIRYIKYWAFAAVLGMGTVSCEDFGSADISGW